MKITKNVLVLSKHDGRKGVVLEESDCHAGYWKILFADNYTGWRDESEIQVVSQLAIS